MKRLILPIFLFALPAFAQEQSPTLQKCEALLGSYVKLNVSVEQAGLALNVQKGIIELCQKLIEAEKPKAEPVAEPKKK